MVTHTFVIFGLRSQISHTSGQNVTPRCIPQYYNSAAGLHLLQHMNNSFSVDQKKGFSHHAQINCQDLGSLENHKRGPKWTPKMEETHIKPCVFGRFALPTFAPNGPFHVSSLSRCPGHGPQRATKCGTRVSKEMLPW